METSVTSILFRYLRACLLIVPYNVIFLGGEGGAAPLGVLLLFGGFAVPCLALGWLGIILALIAPLVPWRICRAAFVTAAVAFLIASTFFPPVAWESPTSGGALSGSLGFFYGCAGFFLLLELGCTFAPPTNTVA